VRRTKHSLRALATAILAASLSFGLSFFAPGAIALGATPDLLGQQAHEGKGDQPFVARPVSASPRVAVRPGRAMPDTGARDLTAILSPVFSLEPPAAAPAPAPRLAQRAIASVPVTSRSSRGPPAA
jgi:hypothetical protein